MIDTHAHLEMCEGTPEELVAAAGAAGVSRIVTIGRGQAVELAERLGEVVAVVGFHPHEAGNAVDLGELEPLLGHPRVVAVGECGLDYYRDYAPRDAQRRLFESQIEIAQAADLPLVIHTRDADDDTFDMLAEVTVPVILHCFSTVRRLSDALERDYYCSFAGNVTYPSAPELRAAARVIPADRLLAETDAPYLAPVPHRGRRNTPANVMLTLEHLATERGVEPGVLAGQIDRNADRVFRLPR